MEKINRFLIRSTYVLLPLIMVAFSTFICCFVTWSWWPDLMTEGERLSIVFFGILALVFGIYLSLRLNRNFK